LAAGDEVLMSGFDVKHALPVDAAQIAPPSQIFPECFKPVVFDMRRLVRSLAGHHQVLLKIDKGCTIETSPADVTSDV